MSRLHRGGVAAFVIALLAVAGYVAVQFLSVIVLSVFLYYSIRPVHRKLNGIIHSPRIRALISLTIFGLPFILLTVFAGSRAVSEVQSVLDRYDSLKGALTQLQTGEETVLISDQEITEILLEAEQQIQFVDGAIQVSQVLQALSTLFIQILLLLILTYVLLVDGPRLRQWFVDTMDSDSVLEFYADFTDHELSQTLFGNVVNVFITAVVGVTVFSLYNAVAPPAVEIPFPALLGVLTGFGSLTPIIGIKLVYIPVAGWLAVTTWTQNAPEGLWIVAGFVIVSAVVIDFIPDTFIRAYVSGDATHTGVLIVAYIMGPSVFGFYGVFLTPILLVLLTTAGYILVPYAVHGTPPSELKADLPRNQTSVFTSTGESTVIHRIWKTAINRINQLVAALKTLF